MKGNLIISLRMCEWEAASLGLGKRKFLEVDAEVEKYAEVSEYFANMENYWEVCEMTLEDKYGDCTVNDPYAFLDEGRLEWRITNFSKEMRKYNEVHEVETLGKLEHDGRIGFHLGLSLWDRFSSFTGTVAQIKFKRDEEELELQNEEAEITKANMERLLQENVEAKRVEESRRLNSAKHLQAFEEALNNNGLQTPLGEILDELDLYISLDNNHTDVVES